MNVQSDRDGWLAAVERDGLTLEHVPREFRQDQEIAVRAIRQNENAFDYISPKLMSTPSFLKNVCQYYELAFVRELVPAQCWGDTSFVIEALSLDLEICSYIASHLYAERDILLAAIRNIARRFSKLKHPSIPQFQKPIDQADLSVVQSEIESALSPTDSVLREDREFILESIKLYSQGLKYAAEHLRSDREIALEAATQDINSLECVGSDLKSDYAFMLQAVQLNGNALKYADEKLLSNRRLVFEAAMQNIKLLRYASRSLLLELEAAIPDLGDERLSPDEPYNAMSEKALADNNCWFDHVVMTGNDVSEQAYETEEDHYWVMEEEADQDVDLVVTEIMDGYEAPNPLHEYKNDLGHEADPRWREDEQIDAVGEEVIGYDIDDFRRD
jgi:hypothetical protein